MSSCVCRRGSLRVCILLVILRVLMVLPVWLVWILVREDVLHGRARSRRTGEWIYSELGLR